MNCKIRKVEADLRDRQNDWMPRRYSFNEAEIHSWFKIFEERPMNIADAPGLLRNTSPGHPHHRWCCYSGYLKDSRYLHSPQLSNPSRLFILQLMSSGHLLSGLDCFVADDAPIINIGIPTVIENFLKQFSWSENVFKRFEFLFSTKKTQISGRGKIVPK